MTERVMQLVSIAVVFAGLCGFSLAQQNATAPVQKAETTSNASNEAADPASVQGPKHYYKLNFILRETDEGKVLNQRSFTMNVAADPADSEKPRSWNLRSGTRLPVIDNKGTAINYIDVGVNLDLKALEATNGLEMEITSEISSAGTENGTTLPPIRQVKVRSAVLAPLGKPTLVFTADDPASTHQFVLEVTPMRDR